MTVSVIIPVLNRYDLTVQCIDSIGDPVELIIVDNASTDATQYLDVAVRNTHNAGFARGCNQGADKASGDILVFLNNDTICHPGWLAITDDLTGTCAPKLLYPDGSIQCAGVGINFEQPWGHEAFNLRTDWTDIRTPVDANTGACLAIPADLFAELGGFDEGFWNGYEDIDLCLRVREAGLPNIYEPAAEVTHLESQSGPERWTAVSENVARLRTKWSNR